LFRALPEVTPSAAGSPIGDLDLAAKLQAAAKGDAHAFDSFYQLSVGRTYALVRRIVGNYWVEDVLADAYFQAWRELSSFDPQRGSAIGWLMSIARSRALDKLRSEKLRSTEPLDDSSQLQLNNALSELPDPESLLQTIRDASRLNQALTQLNPNERWILALAYFRDLTQTEIAAHTGLPLGTVKSLMTRSTRKLKIQLETP
jgi:RNA polymerase sigma-70 factor, ECF subfamily